MLFENRTGVSTGSSEASYAHRRQQPLSEFTTTVSRCATPRSPRPARSVVGIAELSSCRQLLLLLREYRPAWASGSHARRVSAGAARRRRVFCPYPGRRPAASCWCVPSAARGPTCCRLCPAAAGRLGRGAILRRQQRVVAIAAPPATAWQQARVLASRCAAFAPGKPLSLGRPRAACRSPTSPAGVCQRGRRRRGRPRRRSCRSAPPPRMP